jgi:hypothetical protein
MATYIKADSRARSAWVERAGQRFLVEGRR